MESQRKREFSPYLDSVKIYQWIFSILGIALPPPLTRSFLKKSKRNAIYILYFIYCLSLILVVVLFNFFYYGIIQRSADRNHPDSLTIIVTYVQSSALCLVHFVTIVQIFRRISSYEAIMQIIEELENDIELEPNKLPEIHWSIFKTSGCPLFILLACFTYMNCNLMSHSLDTKDRVFIIYYLVTTQMKCIEYGIYIQLVSGFLSHLLSRLEHLKADAEDFISRGCQLPWPLLKQIIKNQMTLNRIWSLVKTLDDYFGWPILLLFYHNGISVSAVVYFAYLRLNSDVGSVQQLYRLGYIIMLLGNLCIICDLAENCIKKYKQISSLMHSFSFSQEDRSLLMRFREYSLQVQHLVLIFRCHGYLDINYSSFGKMLLIVTGYIVILIQFKLEDTSKELLLGSQHFLHKSK